MSIDRVEEWRKFSEHMENYIQDHAIKKYGIDNSNSGGFDLMSISKPIICVWNILRYSLWMWNGKGKEYDLEKIAHYAELAWTISGERSLEIKPLESTE